MEKDLNLFIMSYEEVLNWYKPKTESELYILNLMRNYYEDTGAPDGVTLEDLMSDVKEAEDKLDTCELDLEHEQDENSELRAEISELEKQLEELNQTYDDSCEALINDE